ncbi:MULTISPECIES: alanine dehydrogenase [Methylomonas]|uniref:Alanine dehydrogenase n=2 Tax=Methylomonas TaxID=416 RepID=A0A126T8Y0_9GAMM|nr:MULTISPECIES: alanine dehydrogenase [Methylomonas]AMK78522.1 alanine dehydrogenase [Methylomonas denitrificans]OAI09107.1 alanine dehydrogenase [Methylomonas methanica]TCV82289.1 alanine dehydrogenase [Methylomonas methanica]
MKIGIPKEIKPNENRVSVVPSGVAALVSAGHSITMESGAGVGAGFEDSLYQAAGAQLVDGPEPVWASAEMIVKVKEPIEPEWSRIRPGQTLFTYFHFAANRPLTEAHLASGATCIAYETVQLASGELPLLTPMSEVAGRLAVQEGAHYLEKLYGGRGMLLGGVPGVLPAKVLILGGGVVGTQAAKMAAGLGAQVTVMDLSLERLRQLSDILPANVQLLFSSRHAILEQIRTADLVIGGVLVTGAAAPKLIRAEDLKLMQAGAVIVDVAVDQGGCVETTHPTTHADPIYIIDNVVHYAVANMPGAVPRTSTLALTNATLPYALQLANKGWQQALRENSALLKGLNIVAGNVTCQGISDAFGFNYLSPEQFLN